MEKPKEILELEKYLNIDITEVDIPFLIDLCQNYYI